MQKSRRGVRALLSTALVAVVAAAGVAIAASPAAAATPQCTKSGSVSSAWGPEIMPLSAGGSFNCWLVKGNISDAVIALQKDLNCNGANLAVDGNFGTNTRNAVINFQKYANAYWYNQPPIAVDGDYGPHTASVWVKLPLASGGGCYPVGG